VDLALDYLEHAPAEQFSGEEVVAVADAGAVFVAEDGAEEADEAHPAVFCRDPATHDWAVALPD
jgi:hypothetical protein